MSSSSEDDDSNIPPREVCEERCQSFAEITGTDTALAMFYLQDRKWELQPALNAFFEESSGQPLSSSNNHTQSMSGAVSKTTSNSEYDPGTMDPEPNRIRLITWNIDGLDQGNLLTRLGAVCDKIMKEAPDVVFLQEVVPPMFPILKSRCSTYRFLPADEDGYFTAMLLRKTTVKLLKHDVQPFSSSRMMRTLQTVQATVKDIPVHLITTHLESTKDHVAERKRQLQKAFSAITSVGDDKTVIFGGDLNLRDNELAAIGGLPDSVIDLWECTGKRPEAQYTWDVSRNDNLNWPYKNKPKCRFDRLYLQHSKPSKLKPVYFELIGMERIRECSRFPSDHWGILTHFDKV